MKLSIFIIGVFCFLVPATSRKHPKLLFVQILFRHGDRAPEVLYPTDPNPASVWKYGLGKLTDHGKLQHYKLGKYFRSMYANFATSNPNEVLVNSTGYDRAIRSAECNMASFYAPTPEFAFDKDFAWQPIPIYYKSLDEYSALWPFGGCLQVKIAEGENYLKHLSLHRDLFNAVANYSGTNSSNWQSIAGVETTLYIEKSNNLIIPPWANRYYNKLKKAVDEILYLTYDSDKAKRIIAGVLIKKIIENMNKKLNGEIPDLKFNVFSAHDITIAPQLVAFKFYDRYTMKRPPYCASLHYELFEMEDGSNAVRILYQNSTDVSRKIDPPHVMIVEGCTEFCPLESFIRLTEPLMPGFSDRLCGGG